MQAVSTIACNWTYTPSVPGGRPSTAKRSLFGTRLFQLREERGFSQKQMSEKLGIKQQSYAAWERRAVALKPEQLTRLAEILEVPLDSLVGRQNGSTRKGGPVGKIRLVFEEVSRLPLYQQRKIVEVVQALVSTQRKGKGR
jgi:transcriptional regulator with XRE-family HTH domain